MSGEADLEALRVKVVAAKAQADAPPEEGEVKAIVPMSEYLTEKDWREIRRVVRGFRNQHGPVFALFPEDTLALLLIDELADAEKTPSLSELAERFADLAQGAGPWLISTPITNIVLAEPATQLSETDVLWRATLGQDWMDDRYSGSEDDSAFTVHEMLGDRISRPTRWVQFSDGSRVDTSRGATILSELQGVIGLALPRARARAQYAIAVWSVLSPPQQNQLLPDVGIWIPQPYLQWRQRYKRREHDAWIARERTRGGGIYHWAEYPAPDDETLRAPFEAMAALERRSAQALLSASLAYFQAGRGSRLQLSEQLRNLQTAVETLCEPAPAERGAAERWDGLADNIGLWEGLAERGFSQPEIRDAQERLRLARNVASHGADAVLLDLGYPIEMERPVSKKRQVAGEDLAFSALAADLTPVRFAVRWTLAQLFDRMRRCCWDDAVFESQFT